jgi:thioesterase domain-containing protein
MLRKYVGLYKPPQPKVFRSLIGVDEMAPIVRAIEARAQPLHDAWASYVPEIYPGRITLIRAALREYRPGVVDDDPERGWGRYTTKDVDVDNLYCRHGEMLDLQHSHALAALLRARLPAQYATARESPRMRPIAAG